jgi:surfactin family lipopeptide synthetase A
MINDLIAEQARLNPDGTAVTCGHESLTYSELNRRANQLAHYLRKHGVRPDVMIGICVGRSVEMVVGILGILKAGGAYVPLDPNYPKDRLEHMINEAGSPLLITQKRLLDNLPRTSAKVLSLDADWNQIALEPDHEPQSEIKPETLAYMIFTSGSTGKPKGVLINHANLVHSTKARFVCYPEQMKSYLLISSFAFDSSVAGIFWTLCAGGHLVLPKDEVYQDPAELIRLIKTHSISHFLSLPSLYDLILQQAGSDTTLLSSLNVSIVAGESCPQVLVDRHAQLLPHASLCNEYGPTEGTVWSTFARLEPGRKVTIGKAIPTAQVYVLDENGTPVSNGETGELYVGGLGVAQGYLNRAELTTQKFVHDPFSGKPGARLYRTGDLARLADDGNIEFLGRVDHQVKVRGYRIELEEIEAVLRQHPSVRETVVVAWSPEEAEPAEKCLVAYVATKPGAPVSKPELREFIGKKLPDYMVPSLMMLLDQLPQTPNGKVDRNALPPPSDVDVESSASFVPPATPLEQKVAEIWTDVLRVQQIGRHDDFFAIGGHSLLAIQVIARLREAFQVELPLRTIFDAPTLEPFAAKILEAMLNDDSATDTAATLAEIKDLSSEEVRTLLEAEAQSVS